MLGERYERLSEAVATASLRSGRASRAVRLLGVTKRVDTDRIRYVIGLGLSDIGENRVQEAAQKLPSLASTGVRCHLIGHLQSNKVRRALELFTSIQSIDSMPLAQRIDRMLAHRLPVWIQVRSGAEETKSGVDEEALGPLVCWIRDSKWLDLEGFMAIPPFFEDPERTRPYFAQLRELQNTYDVAGLSMGMSHDFEVAIEEGATQVRVGSLLFGDRA